MFNFTYGKRSTESNTMNTVNYKMPLEGYIEHHLPLARGSQ